MGKIYVTLNYMNRLAIEANKRTEDPELQAMMQIELRELQRLKLEGKVSICQRLPKYRMFTRSSNFEIILENFDTGKIVNFNKLTDAANFLKCGTDTLKNKAKTGMTIGGYHVTINQRKNDCI
jgi:hypothetical protein